MVCRNLLWLSPICSDMLLLVPLCAEHRQWERLTNSAKVSKPSGESNTVKTILINNQIWGRTRDSHHALGSSRRLRPQNAQPKSQEKDASVLVSLPFSVNNF